VKRSRWGSKKEESPADAGGAAADGKKRSRWGAKPTEVSDPLQLAVQLGLPLAALQNMSSEQQASLPRLKQRVDEIDLLLRLPDCGVSDIPEGARSPSPEPTYDQAGTRVNTREMRRRQQLLQQRQELMDSLKPKVGQRCWRKLIVPVDKYPGYNFFGAIIGPRGNAQKRMERESGCKIVIRGKGAIKDGCNRHDGKPLGPEDEEPMHVLIEGPDERTVERGQVLVEAVLNPYSDQAVQQKEKQMRELAIINGASRARWLFGVRTFSAHSLHWHPAPAGHIPGEPALICHHSLTSLCRYAQGGGRGGCSGGELGQRRRKGRAVAAAAAAGRSSANAWGSPASARRQWRQHGRRVRLLYG
jgi:splicing factor 1